MAEIINLKEYRDHKQLLDNIVELGRFLDEFEVPEFSKEMIELCKIEQEWRDSLC